EDSSGHYQAFVDDQVAGTWRAAIEVPGSGALNKAGIAGVISLSCSSAGNCSAGGDYKDGSGRSQAFVVNEVAGTWGAAVEVPGSAALDKAGNAQFYTLSCSSAGNCSAAGSYNVSSHHSQVFVDDEVGGTWKAAIEVPGSAALNKGGFAQVISISCASAGSCSAGGAYRDGAGHSQAFVDNEVGGTWKTAIEVPGSAALNKGGLARVYSLSCPSAGNCSAGGFYEDGAGHSQAFVANES
ncbi:MAG TPA: hypothetical protein VEJ84_06480, partial [Acidimicrobiales bacterium]|nr:hypothetical protein [Acidimicrobiales bacterium]